MLRSSLFCRIFCWTSSFYLNWVIQFFLNQLKYVHFINTLLLLLNYYRFRSIVTLFSLPCTQSVKARDRKLRKTCRAYRIWKMCTASAAAVHVEKWPKIKKKNITPSPPLSPPPSPPRPSIPSLWKYFL